VGLFAGLALLAALFSVRKSDAKKPASSSGCMPTMTFSHAHLAEQVDDLVRAGDAAALIGRASCPRCASVKHNGAAVGLVHAADEVEKRGLPRRWADQPLILCASMR
jgi:hypothetical protein